MKDTYANYVIVDRTGKLLAYGKTEDEAVEALKGRRPEDVHGKELTLCEIVGIKKIKPIINYRIETVR